MRGRALLALLAVAAVVWGVVAVTGGDSAPDSREPVVRVLDLAPGSVTALRLVDPGTGREVLVEGAALDADPARSLADDLTPLLAIRAPLPLRPEYGLDTPRALVEVRSTSRRATLLLGGPNFDGTGQYVRVVGESSAALVLNRVGEAILALLRQGGGGSERGAPRQET